MILNFLCIGLGGFTGACLRALTGIIIAKAGILASFPLATLLVNITGSFLIGFLLSVPYVSIIYSFSIRAIISPFATAAPC